jgi:hypothetical protein
MISGSPTRTRCLAVSAAATSTALTAEWLLATELAAQPATVDGFVVGGCALALAACVGWAWLAALAVVREAWAGRAGARTRAIPVCVRRVLLTACGVAVVGALAHPAAGVDDPRRDRLAGLPMPERPVGAAHRSATSAAEAGSTVLVRPGDCLWSLAAGELGPGASLAEVEATWGRIYRLNKAVIGPDPALIQPGQLLRLPASR